MTSSTGCFRALFAIIIMVAITGCASSPQPSPPSPAALEVVQIAVLPVENLSGVEFPVKDTRKRIEDRLVGRGGHALSYEKLEKFLATHRLRYTGGIDAKTAAAFREETGTDAVLVTSITQYRETFPPKVSISCRLVSVQGEKPEILWIDSVSMTGDQSPGLLGLGIIQEPRLLTERAEIKLINSLASTLAFHGAGPESRLCFDPAAVYRSPFAQSGKQMRVAVLPFFNRSETKYAGDFVALQFVEQLKKAHMDVVEPGEIRYEMLKYRMVMDQGISLADADFIFDEPIAELILTGYVLDYQDFVAGRAPNVQFSFSLLERESKRIVWAASSYHGGDDAVVLFDLGRVPTAQALTAVMVGNAVKMISEDATKQVNVR